MVLNRIKFILKQNYFVVNISAEFKAKFAKI